MSFRLKLKRIDKKNWDEIKSEWIKYIPDVEPGSAPSIQISEIIDLQEKLKSVPDDDELKTEIDGLHASIFHEGIFLLHKANAVARSALSSINHNFHTWSLSNSYQGSYFATKSLLCFLGITLPYFENKYYIVDIFPYPEKLSSSEKKLKIDPERKVKIIKLKNFLHYDLWQILQRVLNTSTINCIDDFIKHKLISLDSKIFAKQRNNLHYQNNYWIMDDMFVASPNSEFGMENSFDKNDTFSPDLRKDFSAILLILLLKLNYKLLEDLSIQTKLFEHDYQLIINHLVDIPQFQEFDFDSTT